MFLKDIGEFGLIERIGRGCLIRSEGVIKAIGDDAAVIRTRPGRVQLITTDLLLERVHFLREAASGADLGYKALAVNLSDIAAMGGTPREAFVSIAVPEDCRIEFLEDLYRGMKALAARYEVNILGGDTTASAADLVINVTLAGEADPSEVLYRHGACVGDVVCVTGSLGDSRAGLHLILNRIAADGPDRQALVRAHLRPRPRVAEGRFLAACGAVHAAIDISDGLSSDLGHIAAASGVGACIHTRQLPLSAPLKAFCGEFGRDPVDQALAGGEDYELLCTVAAQAFESIQDRYARRFGRPLYPIGKVTATGEMVRVDSDGNTVRLAPSGWDHFAKNGAARRCRR
jgi:thiamine-monophosphate kinase